jgi:acyl-CoA thioester hydrolase
LATKELAMSDPASALDGVIRDGRHLQLVRVYYEDTDFSGNVYHAAYLHFFERARTEFLRAEGIHHSELARQGLAFAVRRMEIDFAGAAHIDDLLEVATEVVELSGARLILQQRLYRADVLITHAHVVVVAIRADGRPTRMPQLIRERFGSD